MSVSLSVCVPVPASVPADDCVDVGGRIASHRTCAVRCGQIAEMRSAEAALTTQIAALEAKLSSPAQVTSPFPNCLRLPSLFDQ